MKVASDILYKINELNKLEWCDIRNKLMTYLEIEDDNIRNRNVIFDEHKLATLHFLAISKGEKIDEERSDLLNEILSILPTYYKYVAKPEVIMMTYIEEIKSELEEMLRGQTVNENYSLRR